MARSLGVLHADLKTSFTGGGRRHPIASSHDCNPKARNEKSGSET